jgi:diguanylate cyclase (GGDEF)-like protein
VVKARVRTHLELKESRDLLADLAARDGLTGIANRRRFDEGLATEWRRAVRERSTLSLALLDVDHFKLFNDRYGHAGGDECLRAVAGALRESCRRPGDLVARVGGEEFALLLPGIAASGAAALVGGALDRVRGLALSHAGSPTAPIVTLSGGSVSLAPGEGRRAEAALEAADRLLYAAKQQGRDRGFHEDLDSGERIAVSPRPPGGGP